MVKCGWRSTTHNALEQLTAVSEGSTTKTTYTYDLNGNTTKETIYNYVGYTYQNTDHTENKVSTYAFSVKGELTSAMVSTPSVELGDTPSISVSNVQTDNSYNAAGQRVTKTEGDETMRYYYSGSAVLYTVDSAEVMRTENVLDLSGAIILSARFAYTVGNDDYANGDYLYRYDIRSSVMNIVDEDGEVVTGYTYDEFGNATKTDAQDFLNENEFAGAVSDKSTGFVCMGARFYSPTTGRFISQDTYSGSFFEPWTQHLYSYCNNNPASMIDPTGHKAIKGNPFKQVLDNINRITGTYYSRGIYDSGTYGGYDGYVTIPWVEELAASTEKDKKDQENGKKSANSELVELYQQKTGNYEPLEPGQMYYMDFSGSYEGLGYSKYLFGGGTGPTAGYALVFDQYKYAEYVYLGGYGGFGAGVPKVGAILEAGRVDNIVEVDDYRGLFHTYYGGIPGFVPGSQTLGYGYSEGTTHADGRVVTATAEFVSSPLNAVWGESTTYYFPLSTDWISDSWMSNSMLNWLQE